MPSARAAGAGKGAASTMADNKGHTGALVTVEPQSIFARYLNGETIAQVAESYGVSDVALYYHVIKKAPEEWRDHQAAKALAKYEAAKEALESAQDGLSLGRARELVKTCQWEMERTLRRLYGQDVPVDAGRVHINISLGSPTTIVDAQVIDGKG